MGWWGHLPKLFGAGEMYIDREFRLIRSMKTFKLSLSKTLGHYHWYTEVEVRAPSEGEAIAKMLEDDDVWDSYMEWNVVFDKKKMPRRDRLVESDGEAE